MPSPDQPNTESPPHSPAAPKHRFVIRRVLGVLLIITLTYYIALFFGQRKILYPGTSLDPPQWPIPAHVETITVEHEQGQTHALYLPAATPALTNTSKKIRGTNSPASRSAQANLAPAPLVVFCHGNFQLAEDCIHHMQVYTQRGFSVLIIEYRGYGSSQGKPSQKHIVQDAAQALTQLIERGDVDPDRLLFHGSSLGGGVAGALAQKHEPAALVLESTFRSVTHMARGFGAPSFLVRDPYDTHRFLKTYEKPVLILHGQADQVIPVQHAHDNHAAAPSSTLHIFPDKTHNDAWHPAFLEALNKFLDGLSWGPNP